MSSSRSAKRQLEKARQERQAMKRDRKKERGQGVSTEADDETEAAPGNQETVLAALASLHEAFESKSMDFEEFEAAKAELIGRLRVE